MHSRLVSLNYKNKLLLSYVLVSFFPIIFLGLLISQLYMRSILKNTEDSSISTLDLICGDIDSLIDDTYSVCNMLTNDIKIQQYLRRDFSSLADQYSTDLSGSMDLASISTYKQNLFGVYVLGDNGGLYKSNYCSFKTGDLRQSVWYKTIRESENAVWFPPQNGSFIVRSSISDRFMTMGMKITDKSSGRPSGVITAEIKEDNLTQNISDSFTSGLVCILNQDGSALFSSSQNRTDSYQVHLTPGLISRILADTDYESRQSRVIQDKNYIIVSRSISHTNWCVVGLINRKLLTRGIHNIYQVLLLVLLILLFLSLYISMWISDSISRPVRELYYMMDAVEHGDLSVRIHTHHSDEFETLNNSFNKMLSRIQKLIGQIYEEQTKLKNSELKALQAQIQPHFLYNSLDSVIWLLRMNKNADAESMLSELSTFFKISLSKGKEIILIKDELRHVHSYLFITTMIYGKKFDYSIECDPCLYDYQTLKLILQPLVENVVLHATAQEDSKIYIQLRIYEKDSDLILSVQDISMGMTPDACSRLVESLSTPMQDRDSKSGYGLYNVNERIHILFGKEYGIFVESEYGFGTEVYIKIPKIKGDDNIVSSNTM
ncbi:MAG: sensor histidine kinase [Lachnospiraceae bacterium]|nr:sensor histidine kinase [Lachnospiraceae bacterium]